MSSKAPAQLRTSATNSRETASLCGPAATVLEGRREAGEKANNKRRSECVGRAESGEDCLASEGNWSVSGSPIWFFRRANESKPTPHLTGFGAYV